MILIEFLTEYYKEEKDPCEQDEDLDESTNVSILDPLEVNHTGIEIEDDIRMGYLWKKYKKITR